MTPIKMHVLLNGDGFTYMSQVLPQTSSIMKKKITPNVNTEKKKIIFFPPTTWHSSLSENNRALVENNSVWQRKWLISRSIPPSFRCSLSLVSGLGTSCTHSWAQTQIFWTACTPRRSKNWWSRAHKKVWGSKHGVQIAHNRRHTNKFVLWFVCFFEMDGDFKNPSGSFSRLVSKNKFS